MAMKAFDKLAVAVVLVLVFTALSVAYVPLSSGLFQLSAVILLAGSTALLMWAAFNLRNLKRLFVANSFEMFLIGVFVLGTSIDDSVLRLFGSESQIAKDEMLASIPMDGSIIESITLLFIGPKNIIEWIFLVLLVLLFTLFPASRAQFLKSVNIYVFAVVTILEKLSDKVYGRNKRE